MRKQDGIVILGIGNVLMSDEGLGVRVVEKLVEEYSFPESVEIYDGGVTGMMGLLPIIEDAGRLIIVDAINAPGDPGDLFRRAIDEFRLSMPKKLSIHDVGIMECLAIAEVNGRSPETTVVIGAKPADITTPGTRLTDVIRGRLEDLVSMVIEEARGFGVEIKKKSPGDPVRAGTDAGCC